MSGWRCTQRVDGKYRSFVLSVAGWKLNDRNMGFICRCSLSELKPIVEKHLKYTKLMVYINSLDIVCTTFSVRLMAWIQVVHSVHCSTFRYALIAHWFSCVLCTVLLSYNWAPWCSVRSCCDGSLDHYFMVDPLRFVSFQPVLHDWCTKAAVCSILYVGYCI